MGVYIKSMDAPKTCFDCPFMYARTLCSANTRITFDDPGYSELKWRHKDCPLVPVPAHGRLFDADKLEEDINHDIENTENYLNDPGFTEADRERFQADIDFLEGIRDVLAQRPTVIPAEAET